MPKNTTKDVWFGSPGHLICAYKCRYHLHTHVSDDEGRRYCVSTVGEYYRKPDGKMETIGVDRFYETMVFASWLDDSDNKSWSELAMRPYNTREAADKGHMKAIADIKKGIINQKKRID